MTTILLGRGVKETRMALTHQLRYRDPPSLPFCSGFVYRLLRSALTREKEARPLHPEPFSVADARCCSARRTIEASSRLYSRRWERMA